MYLLLYGVKQLLIAAAIYACTRFVFLEWLGNVWCGIRIFDLLVMCVCHSITRRDYAGEDAVLVLTEQWKALEIVQAEMFEHKKETSQRPISKEPCDLWVVLTLISYKDLGLVEQRRIPSKRRRFKNIEFRLTEAGRRHKDQRLEALKEGPPPLHGFISPVPAK